MIDWGSPDWPTIQEVEFAARVFESEYTRLIVCNSPEIAAKCAISTVWAHGRMYEAKKLTYRDLARIMYGEEEHTAQRLEAER